MAEEIGALTALRERVGTPAFRTAVTRALARDVVGAEYLTVLAAVEPELPVAVPRQRQIDRDLATYEAFVQADGRV